MDTLTSMNESFRRGVRLGLPFAAAGFLLSLSFGVLAREAGFSAVQAIVTSAIVFAGSAQFAVVAILLGGGGMAPAVAASGLMNSRFLAMGIALAPSLPGGPLKRAAQGQTVVDASWVMANNGDGTFDRWLLFGSTAPQYVTWFCGTAVGALASDGFFDPERLGLDAIFPAFFLVLLIGELKNPRTRLVALVGAAIALALVPFTPAGIPVLAASAAALIGRAR